MRSIKHNHCEDVYFLDERNKLEEDVVNLAEHECNANRSTADRNAEGPREYPDVFIGTDDPELLTQVWIGALLTVDGILFRQQEARAKTSRMETNEPCGVGKRLEEV